MNLTLIKVKGRGRKIPWQPPDPSRIKSNRRRRDDEEDYDSAASDLSGSSKRSKKASNPQARLENLPNELLWPIAVMSQNPNLMRINRQLRKTLLAKSFSLELAVGAFGPTWDKYFGLSKLSLASGEYEPDQFPGDYQFQGDVLAARWMNIDFILEAQQVWYRQQGKKRRWEKSQCIYWVSPSQTQLVQEGQQAEGEQDAEEAEDKDPEVPEIQVWFDQEWQEFCEAFSIIDDNGAYKSITTIVAKDKDTKKGYLDLHPLTPIPDRLLKGPFDLEKTKLLFWLVRGGARILPQHNWEVTKVGFEQIMALEKVNITLAPYLLFFYHYLGVFDWGHWPDFLLQAKLDWLLDMMHELSPADAPEKHLLYHFAFGLLAKHGEIRPFEAEIR